MISRLDSYLPFPLRSAHAAVGLSLRDGAVACSRCPRSGSYRLARLADRYGAEITLPYLIEALAADCKLRDHRRLNLYDRCGAYFPDINGGRPPDEPVAAKPRLR